MTPTIDLDWRHEGGWVELWLSEHSGAWEYVGRCLDETPLEELRDTSLEVWHCQSLAEVLPRLAETRLMGDRLLPYRVQAWYQASDATREG